MPFLGYTRKELLTKSIEDVSFKVDNVPQIFAQYLKQGAMEGDYVLQHKDGSAIPIHFRAFTCRGWLPCRDMGLRSRIGASRIWRR